MNLRFTPSALALALTLSATSVALTNVDANAAGGGALADRYSDGAGEKKKDDARRRAERMFPLLDASNDAAAGVGGAFFAGPGGKFDAADAGILGLRRLHRNRPLFGGAVGRRRRSLQEDEDEEATCIKPDTCEPSLCNCTAAGGMAYDCAAELDALCNNVTAANGTLFTIKGCVNDASYYYNLYCPFAKCVVDGGTKEECDCEFYKNSCEIYDIRRYKVSRSPLSWSFARYGAIILIRSLSYVFVMNVEQYDEKHIMHCAIDKCCLDKTDDVGRAMCFEDPLHMVSTENLNQIETIKKRAGHLWRFL